MYVIHLFCPSNNKLVFIVPSRRWKNYKTYRSGTLNFWPKTNLPVLRKRFILP